MRGRPRPRRASHTPGRMNKTEELYSLTLREMQMNGLIVRWAFEPIKLRLADRTTYSPDFMVTYPGHIELHEVKGHWEDDARVKWKVTAEMYPEFEFVAVKKRPKKHGGGWEVERYGR